MKSDKTTQEKTHTLGEHLAELRKRLIVCIIAVIATTILAFVFEGYIESLITRPVYDVLRAFGEENPRIYVFQWAGTLVFQLHICLMAGLVIASPVCAWQVWKFISAGLYSGERRLVYIFGPFSLLLFLAGVVAGYLFLLPISLKFLIAISAGSDFRFMPEIRDTLSFVITLPVAMGIVFELPLVVFFLDAVGVVPVKTFARLRKYFILVFFIIAAIVTPPDVVSQIGVAIPMILLFEGGIILCKIFGRKKVKEQV